MAPLLSLFIFKPEKKGAGGVWPIWETAGAYCTSDLCFVIPLDWVSSLSPWWSSCNMLVAGLLHGLLSMTEPSSSSSSSSKELLATVSKPLRESSEPDSDGDEETWWWVLRGELGGVQRLITRAAEEYKASLINRRGGVGRCFFKSDWLVSANREAYKWENF